jgi:hypothetical protein
MNIIYKYQHLIDNPNIDWNGLSDNEEAIHILEKNLDKVNWLMLSTNPAAIHIIEANLELDLAGTNPMQPADRSI